MTVQRQQVLHLYTTNSSIGSHVVAWAFHDGADGQGPDIPDRDGSPPYVTGLDALRDGWRLLQMSQLLPPREGEQHKVSYLPFEFLLERMIDVDEVVEPNGPNTRGLTEERGSPRNGGEVDDADLPVVAEEEIV